MESPQQIVDKQAIARLARGDQEAFSALYDRLCGPLYAMALRMTGDAAEAQDALQDAFLQIWRRAAAYDATRGSVFTWAVLITRGRVIDRLRARGRRLRVVVESNEDSLRFNSAGASDSGSAADTVEKKDAADRLRSALNELPPEQREAIEMAFFADLTHYEIATRLGQPLGTIKARIRRGLLRLGERFRRST